VMMAGTRVDKANGTHAWARRTLGDELWRRLAMRLCPPCKP
jgi:hypothetical protein